MRSDERVSSSTLTISANTVFFLFIAVSVLENEFEDNLSMHFFIIRSDRLKRTVGIENIARRYHLEPRSSQILILIVEYVLT